MPIFIGVVDADGGIKFQWEGSEVGHGRGKVEALDGEAIDEVLGDLKLDDKVEYSYGDGEGDEQEGDNPSKEIVFSCPCEVDSAFMYQDLWMHQKGKEKEDKQDVTQD